MSIAELIMTGTERASKSTDWVADSLAKIGDNVSKVLREREQQKQAQEMLPFLQQSMQESMTLAGSGKTGEAYAKLMPFLADPSVINNPFLRQVIPAFESGIKMAGDQLYKKEELRIREDMYGAKSDYQNLLLGLKEKQAAAKAEVDNRRLAILEDKNNLMWQRNQTQDENEKARIDNKLQELDQKERRLDADIAYRQQKLGSGQDTSFEQSYEGAAGIGGPRASIPPSEQRSIAQDAQNAVANSYLLPEETPKKPTGIPAMGASETPAIPFTLESPAASFTQLGEKPYEPSEEEVQRFVKNFNKYESASPKGKQKIESKRTIVYDNLEELEKDLPSFNTEQIAFTQVDAGIVDPELFGIKYLRNKEKGRNAQGNITAYGLNEGAVKSVQDLQTAFDLVNRSPELNELYTKAGGWKGVQLKETPKQEASEYKSSVIPEKYEVINRKTKEAIKVSKDDYNKLQAIEAMVATANTMGMDFITVKGQQPAATETPAPAPSGLPATQPQPAAAIPEEAIELQKIVEQEQAAKAKETAKNVEKRIQDIDNEIKTLSSGTKITSAAPYAMTGAMGPYAMSSGSSVQARSKTSEEAQADIQKITQLKAERQLLFAKTEKAYNAAKSEGRVFQNADEVKSSKKKFPAGTIIYIGREPAKVK